MGSCNVWDWGMGNGDLGFSKVPKSRSDEEGGFPDVGGTGRSGVKKVIIMFDETRLFASTDECSGRGGGVRWE